MQRLASFCLLVIAAIICTAPANAASRIALVIGNGSYPKVPLARENTPFLPTAVGDDATAGRQQAILFDEDRQDPKGHQYVGHLVWGTERLPKTNEMVVKADIEIPERKLTLTLAFRHNTDPTLPASHTVEFSFKLPKDFADGGIADIPGLLTKPDRRSKGTPLAGLSVKVTNSFFLFGLSNKGDDLDSNLRLLKEGAWLDIPMLYANQKRAIITIEMGEPGKRAFADAFAVWGQ